MHIPGQESVAHPHVVIQEDSLNHDESVSTVVVCALTTNARKVNFPGNILLEAGEANLPKQSIVEVSKIAIIEKAQLGEYIGALSEDRMKQIAAGRQFVQRTYFTR